jgi:hypothetical protein
MSLSTERRGSHLVQQGIPLSDVQQQLGHARTEVSRGCVLARAPVQP